MLVCRYLFRRCDNEAAPWSGADAGDGPWAEDDLPEEAVAEITRCTEAVHYAGANPSWAYDAAKREWGWTKAPPVAAPAARKGASKAALTPVAALTKEVKAVRPALCPATLAVRGCLERRCGLCCVRARAALHTADSMLPSRELVLTAVPPVQLERALSKYTCQISKTILVEPVATPCGHFFSKVELLAKFEAEAGSATSSARTFRQRKPPKHCPKCNADLSDFAKTLQVNHAMAAEIEQYRAKLLEASDKLKAAKAHAAAAWEEETDAALWPATAEAAKGWRVEVWWPDEKTHFGGVVDGVTEGGQVTVKYDDGDEQEHCLKEDKFRWMKAAPVAEEAGPDAGAASQVCHLALVLCDYPFVVRRRRLSPRVSLWSILAAPVLVLATPVFSQHTCLQHPCSSLATEVCR